MYLDISFSNNTVKTNQKTLNQKKTENLYKKTTTEIDITAPVSPIYNYQTTYSTTVDVIPDNNTLLQSIYLDSESKEQKEETITDDNTIQKLSIDQVEIPKRNMEIPQFVLDPLSVIVKLAILSKKPSNSKLSIDGNNIYINEPGIFQSFVRFVFNKNKYDLHYLFNPIEIACSKYLDSECDKDMVSLFESAIDGLQKLIKTYEVENVLRHTLFYYINIINNHINNANKNELFMRDSNTDTYNDVLLEKLQNMWTTERIRYMLNTFIFIQVSKNEKEMVMNVKCLEEFMKQIDDNVSITIKMLNMKALENLEKPFNEDK